jgi:Fic family protein
MTWNWQQPDWPVFNWDRLRMSTAEKQFLLGAGVAIGTVKHLGEDEHNQLLVEVMSGEAVTTSAIEGEVLNRASVQSRDLADLTEKGALVRTGERKHARYALNLRRSLPDPLHRR